MLGHDGVVSGIFLFEHAVPSARQSIDPPPIRIVSPLQIAHAPIQPWTMIEAPVANILILASEASILDCTRWRLCSCVSWS
jgi:hypothetical protein